MKSHCPWCRMLNQMIWVHFIMIINNSFSAEEKQQFLEIEKDS